MTATVDYRQLDTTGIDFDDFRHQPLDNDALRCLRYMHDVEMHTICYLRDLLVTVAHKDPEITRFFTFWNFQEYWHGEALAGVLAANGESTTDRVSHMRERLGWKDRVAPLSHALGSAIAGESFVAIHMTWGAINEWTTQAAYARLMSHANHPTLSTLLRRIMRQEGRHIDFYVAEARRRLDHVSRARRLTRFALRHLWSPVGSTVMPPEENAFMATYLFGDKEGRSMAERIDRRIDQLPGLAGLALMTGRLSA